MALNARDWLTDEEESCGSEDAVLQKDVEKSMDKIYEQRGSFKQNDDFDYNLKEILAICGAHNEYRRLGEFNTHGTY